MAEKASDINVDISVIPFSRYGAYIALFDDGEESLSLYWSMRQFSEKMFSFSFIYEGKAVKPSFSTDAICITAVYKNAKAEIYIKDDETVAFCSKGFGLRVKPSDPNDDCYGSLWHNGKYELISYCNHYYAGAKVVSGSAEISLGDCKDKRNTEISIHSLKNDRFVFLFNLSEEQTNFENAYIDTEKDLSDIENEWRTFLLKMPSVKTEYYDFAKQSLYNIWAAFVRKSEVLPYDTLIMSKKRMCAIWSWDNCFNALALKDIDFERAVQQFLIPYTKQSKTGAMPDLITCSGEAYYGITKPPIHGWTFEKIFKNSNGRMSEKILNRIYNAMSKQTEWWFKYRDTDGDSIPDYPQGCDSGADNSSVFKELGYFLETPDLTCYLILQMRTLAVIAERLNKIDESVRWETRRKELYKKLCEHSLKDNKFAAVKSGSHERAEKAQSFIELMPLILGEELDDAIRNNLIKLLKSRYLTENGISSESYKNKEFYESDGYWLGPVWAPVTYMLTDGLRRSGHKTLAKEIAEKYINMVMNKAKGNYENFDAVTGKGLRAPGYTWTASVTLILMKEISCNEYD